MARHHLMCLDLYLAPFFRSISAIAVCFIWVAIYRGVAPVVEAAFTAAPFSSSNATTSRWPFCAARCRGVAPFEFGALTSAPFFNRACTWMRSP